MPDIDAEAAGILIGNGVDPLTAVAGSIIDEPRPRARGSKHPRLVMVLAVVAAVAVVIVMRTF